VISEHGGRIDLGPTRRYSSHQTVTVEHQKEHANAYDFAADARAAADSAIPFFVLQ
jgi:hypothetical protein